MTTYHVRKYGETCEEYKRTTQETIDDTWVPGGCEEHTLRDFVIEWTEA